MRVTLTAIFLLLSFQLGQAKAGQVDFTPLLDAFLELDESKGSIEEKIGGVFEDAKISPFIRNEEDLAFLEQDPLFWMAFINYSQFKNSKVPFKGHILCIRVGRFTVDRFEGHEFAEQMNYFELMPLVLIAQRDWPDEAIAIVSCDLKVITYGLDPVSIDWIQAKSWFEERFDNIAGSTDGVEIILGDLDDPSELNDLGAENYIGAKGPFTQASVRLEIGNISGHQLWKSANLRGFILAKQE